MYEEEKKNSFIKDFIIKLLYMFLFLFLFMWLYPAPKVDLSDVEVKVDKTELQPLFAGVFNDNINAMKEAAKSYYTIDRLPDTNGKSTKMTLQEMLNKKMVAPFVDANGKSCNASSSYVEVTRVSSTEYTMKVNLECSDKTDYIIETIGCTSVCPGCVATPSSTTATSSKSTTTKSSSGTTTKVVYQTVPTPVTPSTNNNNTNNNNTNNDKDNTTTPETKTYVYTKKIENKEWQLKNSWTTTKKTGDDVRVYDTRTVYGDTIYKTKRYTYGTISWVSSWDDNVDYSLYLNNIPSTAKNVRITSQSKMTTVLSSYLRDRNECNIQMVGSKCPNYESDGIDHSTDPTIITAPSYSFNVTATGFQGNKYTVRVTGYAHGTLKENYIYNLPVKFTVQWQEPSGRETIKQYKYEYLETTGTTTDTKYSTSNKDTSLLNEGYKLVGTK